MVVDSSEVAVDRAPSLVEDSPSERLKPYVPRLAVEWLRHHPERAYQEVEGSLAFVDISGFTKLTERLARKGKVGAEEMSDTLNATFAALLDVAYSDGAGLVKWGGDAVLLLFEGPLHAKRAARAAYRMRATMRQVGQLQTSAGRVTLRMSVGIHSGTFHFFLVGDPAYHRELIVSGPAASMTAVMEATADAGEIGLSPATAALLDPRCVGKPKGDAFLLRGEPDIPTVGVPPVKDVHDLDLAGVLPVPIRQHLLEQPGEAEHRTIAVAFVQFSGTDALLEQEGPQALADALHDVMANVQQATASHDVTFFETDINRDGGKIMLTAGAPVSHGHEEDRMLRAARLIIERAGTLPLRIGVNRGPVFSGDFGPFFRRTYSVKGDAINLAARVMGKASPGEVLATRATLDRARTSFATEPLAPFLVKGKSQPVHACRLGPIVGSAETLADLPPIVGRAAELAVLEEAVDRVRGRTGGRVQVIGEPGIGKTRLVQELQPRCDDLSVVATAADEYEQNTPYLPVRRLFRAALGVATDAPAELVERRLRDRLALNAPELTPWLPLLGIVLGIDLPPTRETRELDESFRKGRLESVAVELLTHLLPTPTLLLVEDLHFLDDASLDLLRGIARAAGEGQPWLVVATARDDAGFTFDDGLPETVLELSRLDPEASLALILDATEEHPLPPTTMAALVERSGGNPLFLRGLLLVAASGNLDQLPDTIDGLVTAEIDRLPPAQRRILRYAAVLGTTVDEDLLRQMLDDASLPTGRSAFSPLRAFIQSAGPGRLRFRHNLIRDAAYDGLPYRRRRALHEQAGTLLLERLPDPEANPEPLAMHFFHAGRSAEAWTYARLAGERARAQYAQSEAARFLYWAVESGRRAGAPPLQVAETLEALGDVRYFLGLTADAATAYRQALPLVKDDPVRQAGLLLKEGRLQQRGGNLPRSLRTLTRGMRLVEGLSTPESLDMHSRLATRYAIGRYQEGQFRAAYRWGSRAVQLAEEAHAVAALAEAHNVLQALAAWSTDGDSTPHGEIALRLFEQSGNLTGQGHCLNNLAFQAIFDGRWDAAQKMLDHAAQIFAQVGDEASLSAAVYNQADVMIRQGRIAEAEPLLRQALRVARSVADEETVALVNREAGKAAARAGRFEESRARLLEAITLLTELGEPQEVADAEAAIAESYLLEGLWRDALDGADRSLDRPDTPARVRPTLHRVRGYALLLAGDVPGAKRAFVTGLSLGESPTTRHERAFLLAGLARVAAAEGASDAERLLAESEQALVALGVVAAPIPR